MEDCFNEVAGELETLNDSIVNQVCKAEFMVPTSPSEISSPNAEFPLVDIFEGQPVQMSVSPSSATPDHTYVTQLSAKETTPEPEHSVSLKHTDNALQSPASVERLSVKQDSSHKDEKSPMNASEDYDDTYDDEFEEVTDEEEEDEDDSEDYEDEDDGDDEED